MNSGFDRSATVYDRQLLVEVLVAHQRASSSACFCGWDVLGASHPEHIADKYEEAVGLGWCRECGANLTPATQQRHRDWHVWYCRVKP